MESQALAESLLDALRALHWSYWTSHWQAKGPAAYGDHLLFERLYTALVAQIDQLAEKMVVQFGQESLDIPRRDGMSFLSVWGSEQDHTARGLQAENAVLTLIDKLYQTLKAEGTLSKGWDDMLMAMFSDHETNLYLLGQRGKTAGKANVR
jgi:DNA-binding ferritin-like protein